MFASHYQAVKAPVVPAVPVYVDPNITAMKVFNAAYGNAKKMGFANVRSVWGVMRTKDFINLRGFGLNRDVMKRIKAKANTHLKGDLTSAQQLNVAVVVTTEANGSDFYNAEKPIMKIDGHSRCAAWLTNKLVMPEFVNVQFFFNLSDEDIVNEYHIFTNSKAQATQAEKNDISNKMAHWLPKSDFCQASWKNAFTLCGSTSYEEGLETYRDCLEIVDSWNVIVERGKASTRRHVSGIKAAILETWEQCEDDAALVKWADFWKDFFTPSNGALIYLTPAELEKTDKVEGGLMKIKAAHTLALFCKEQQGSGSALDNKTKKEALKVFKKYSK